MRRTVPLLILVAVSVPGCTRAWLTGSQGTLCESCLTASSTGPSMMARCRNWCSSKFSSTSRCGPNCYNARFDCRAVCCAAKTRADQALKRYRMECGMPLSCHFCTGFEQAYIDIAKGGTGALPALPPARYWHACYRTEEGFGRADEWFEGYRIGASWAESEGMMQYNHIPVSPPLPPPAGPRGACGATLPVAAPGYGNPSVGANHGGTPVIGAPEYVGPGAKVYTPALPPQAPTYGPPLDAPLPQFSAPPYPVIQIPGTQYSVPPGRQAPSAGSRYPGIQYPAPQYQGTQYPSVQYPGPQYPVQMPPN